MAHSESCTMAEEEKATTGYSGGMFRALFIFILSVNYVETSIALMNLERDSNSGVIVFYF